MCSVLKYVPPLDNWSPFNVLCAVAAKDSSSTPAAHMDDSAMNDTMSSQSSSSSVSSLDSGCDNSSSFFSQSSTAGATIATSSQQQNHLTSDNICNKQNNMKHKILMRMVSEAGCGSRQDEEALAASALLDLATADSDTCRKSPAAASAADNVAISNKTSVITSNPTLSSSSSSSCIVRNHRPLSPHAHHDSYPRPDQRLEQENRLIGDKDGLVHLMVTSNANGQSVLQLPNGMEFLFDPRPGTTPPSSISLPSSLVNGTLLSSATGGGLSASSPESGRQYAVIDLSKKKVKQESQQDKNDNNNNNYISSDDQENPCPDPRHYRLPERGTPVELAHRLSDPSSFSFTTGNVVHSSGDECRSDVPIRVLPPNVMHFVPNSSSNHHMSSSDISGGVFCDNVRRSFSSGSSSCSSVDGSESCGSSSGGGRGGILMNSNTVSSASGIRKRGRKRLYDDCSTNPVLMDHHHHHQHHRLNHHNVPSNPIKEFRQRQRVRERQEDERLQQLETRYKNSANFLTLAVPLDELYDSRGLNMKFPRVKTAMKRGKAADDSERTNRKKECARRDSKNYRERAKAKRDLIVKKIAFLEDLLQSVSVVVPKFQYVF